MTVDLDGKAGIVIATKDGYLVVKNYDLGGITIKIGDRFEDKE